MHDLANKELSMQPSKSQRHSMSFRCTEISHKDVRNYGPDNRRSGHVSSVLFTAPFKSSTWNWKKWHISPGPISPMHSSKDLSHVTQWAKSLLQLQEWLSRRNWTSLESSSLTDSDCSQANSSLKASTMTSSCPSTQWALTNSKKKPAQCTANDVSSL